MLYVTLLDVFSDSSQPLEASADAIKLWSKFHLSPGDTTPMRRPDFIAAKATALQFLKHPVKVGVAPVAKIRDELLGEGSASRVPLLICISDAGDS